MILTSVFENSGFPGQSDYDLNHVRQPTSPLRRKFCSTLAPQRPRQPRADVAFSGLGFFGWGHGHGPALGGEHWISAARTWVDGQGHAPRCSRAGLAFLNCHAFGGLASLGTPQVFGHRRKSRHLFLRVVRAACCDPHQRLQPNQLPLGLTGLWRRCALCVALEHGASRWRGRSLLSCRSCVHWLCIHGCIFWA